MKLLWRHIALMLVSGGVAIAIAALAGGERSAWITALAVLSLWLSWHLLHIGRLAAWLMRPRLAHLPRGTGLWRQIHAALYQQAKSRKRRKQRLKEALSRFRRAAEALPDGMIVLTRDGRIEWLNRIAALHLQLDHERDRNAILANLVRQPAFHQFLQKRDASQLTLVIARRTLTITRTPFEKNADLIITSDTSSAEKLNATRSAFVANVSHELRTPLTVINGFLEILADDIADDTHKESIALMRDAGKRMETLLNDLLTLSRLESGDRPPHQILDLAALARQIAEDGKALSQGRHHIHAEITPDLHMNGHAPDLYSALANLVQNAVRYTPEGGHIHIRLTREGNHARFSVADTGPGIAAEHLPHLSERFYRADPGRSRQNGGTGLGLAISKHALAEHHATLDIQSTVGEGSTFATRLPLIAAEEKATGI